MPPCRTKNVYRGNRKSARFRATLPQRARTRTLRRRHPARKKIIKIDRYEKRGHRIQNRFQRSALLQFYFQKSDRAFAARIPSRSGKRYIRTAAIRIGFGQRLSVSKTRSDAWKTITFSARAYTFQLRRMSESTGTRLFATPQWTTLSMRIRALFRRACRARGTR